VTLGRQTRQPDPDIVPCCAFKNVSRKHLSIYYDVQSKQWKVKCLGKNGIRVGPGPQTMQFLGIDQEAPLVSPTRIEIGEFFFYFLLPSASAVRRPPAAKEKPTIPYTKMLWMAIDSTNDKIADFPTIHNYILENWSYYKTEASANFPKGLRNLLSHNAAFIKAGMGKAATWALNPTYTIDTIPPTVRAKKPEDRPADAPAEAADDEDGGDDVDLEAQDQA